MVVCCDYDNRRSQKNSTWKTVAFYCFVVSKHRRPRSEKNCYKQSNRPFIPVRSMAVDNFLYNSEKLDSVFLAELTNRLAGTAEIPFNLKRSILFLNINLFPLHFLQLRQPSSSNRRTSAPIWTEWPPSSVPPRGIHPRRCFGPRRARRCSCSRTTPTATCTSPARARCRCAVPRRRTTGTLCARR